MKKLYSVLNYDNLKIFQDDSWFCFSLDSIILANLCSVKLSTKKIADFGTGNGIVPLILAKRTTAHIDGIEIQKDVSQLAFENVEYNKLNTQISIINSDIKVFSNNRDNYDKYDLVVCNPPYFKADCLFFNEDLHKTIARHEFKITLSEIIESAWRVLKEGGIFSMVNRVDRFIEILSLFNKFRFEVKYIRFIYDRIDLSPCMFFIEVVKLGKPGLKIDKPFILKNIDGSFTDEYERLQNEVKK